ncbi:shikimate/quinate 5-dehydrogenase I beta [Hydrogenimonas sp.]|nr:shikimate/quinate 5-dehydrogenase I beta [Hydrogenimonas sp.]
MIDEGILSKESRLVALYGSDAQSSPFLKILNGTFKSLGLADYAIGLNISPEDFPYMVRGMPQSKVTMALYEPEYQEVVVPLLDYSENCIRRSGICDGAYAENGKLYGKCFYPAAFELMMACEGINLHGARVLLMGAGTIAGAVLPLLGVMGAEKIVVADTVVERAAELLEKNSVSLAGVECDIIWFNNGMQVDVSEYDMIVNAVDIHAHSDKRIIAAEGKNGDLVLIDFIRGKSPFDTIASELGCRKLGSDEWMLSTSLCVAREWLGAEVECEDYAIAAEKIIGG